MTLNWQDRAACINKDVDLFFISQGASGEPAKRICRSCPVRRECLDYAMENNEVFGIWGGLSAHERIGLRRRSLKRGAA